jgi:hypothetical protein
MVFREPFPILSVEDVERAARLYTSHLGFDFRDPDGHLLHIAAKL